MWQVLLSPLVHNVLLLCVEELGGQSEPDSSWGQILCPQMLGTQKGHTQAGGSGQPLPVRGAEWGLALEAARVEWRSSGNARQLRDDVLSCPPPT